jgi:hypothetical protein
MNDPLNFYLFKKMIVMTYLEGGEKTLLIQTKKKEGCKVTQLNLSQILFLKPQYNIVLKKNKIE